MNRVYLVGHGRRHDALPYERHTRNHSAPRCCWRVKCGDATSKRRSRRAVMVADPASSCMGGVRALARGVWEEKKRFNRSDSYRPTRARALIKSSRRWSISAFYGPRGRRPRHTHKRKRLRQRGFRYPTSMSRYAPTGLFP